MSADNYYFVGKKFDCYTVSHRFASIFYSDEISEPPMEGHGFTGTDKGWTINGDSKNAGILFETLEEAEKAATRRPDWITDPPEPLSVHTKLEEAVMAAHRFVAKDAVVEYGVIVQPGLM